MAFVDFYRFSEVPNIFKWFTIINNIFSHHLQIYCFIKISGDFKLFLPLKSVLFSSLSYEYSSEAHRTESYTGTTLIGIRNRPVKIFNPPYPIRLYEC